jgi:hypothetical protein
MGFVNFLSLMTNKSIQNTHEIKMSNGNGRIKFPINGQPKERKNHKLRNTLILWWTRNSTYRIATDDIQNKKLQLKARGIEFYLRHQYISIMKPYQNVWDHTKMMKDINEIENSFMVDADEEGYLLQYLPNLCKIKNCFFDYSKNGSQRFCRKL